MKMAKTESVLGMTTMTNEEFAYKVSLYLERALDDADRAKRTRALASAMKIVLTTPVRWATGSSVPHDNIQSKVLLWIEEHS